MWTTPRFTGRTRNEQGRRRGVMATLPLPLCVLVALSGCSSFSQMSDARANVPTSSPDVESSVVEQSSVVEHGASEVDNVPVWSMGLHPVSILDATVGTVLIRPRVLGEVPSGAADSWQDSMVEVTIRDLLLDKDDNLPPAQSVLSLKQMKMWGSPANNTDGPPISTTDHQSALGRLRGKLASGDALILGNAGGDDVRGPYYFGFGSAFVFERGRLVDVVVLGVLEQGNELVAQFHQVAKAAGRQPDESFLRDWADEDRHGKSAVPITELASSLLFPPPAPPPPPPSWSEFDPKTRPLDSPLNLPPADVAARLQSTYIQFEMPESFNGSFEGGTVILRSATGVLKSVSLSAGSIATPAQVVPGEDIEVLHVRAGFGFEGPVVGTLPWAQFEGASRLLVSVGGNVKEPTFKIAGCGAAVTLPCPPNQFGTPARPPTSGG